MEFSATSTLMSNMVEAIISFSFDKYSLNGTILWSMCVMFIVLNVIYVALRVISFYDKRENSTFMKCPTRKLQIEREED